MPVVHAKDQSCSAKNPPFMMMMMKDDKIASLIIDLMVSGSILLPVELSL